MQHTPIVELPTEHPRHDWWLIAAVVVMILVAALATVMLVRPDLLTTTREIDHYTNPELSQFEQFQARQEALVARRYANPELIQFERFQAERAAAAAVAGPQNPELSAAARFADARMLIENPEVRQAIHWMEQKR